MRSDKKIVAMMPIKLNSKRIPNKNIKLLNGKPLLYWNLTMLQSIKEVDEIYVYCSDETIRKFLPKGVSFLKREKSLDSDDTNWTQFFDAFNKEVRADIYVCSHATAPFVSISSTQQLLNNVLSGEYDSAFTAKKIQDFLWTSDLKPLNFEANNIPRSQDLDFYYQETSGVYVFKREVFEKHHRRIGNNPYILEVSFKEAIDINEPSDFELAQILATNWGGGGING